MPFTRARMGAMRREELMSALEEAQSALETAGDAPRAVAGVQELAARYERRYKEDDCLVSQAIAIEIRNALDLP